MFTNENILITGAAGYIGSHCALELLQKGYNVIIFDNLSTGHIETIQTLKNYGNLIFYNVDLCDREKLSNVFKKCGKINAVMHFAGLSLVSESSKMPQEYYKNNVIASINLFEEIIKHDIKKIIFSSSAAIYGIPENIPITESDSKKPINVYGKTKLIIENILNDYDRIYNLKSLKLRYFNVIGANPESIIGEWHKNETHLIPNIINSCENHKFCLYGGNYNTKDGTCIRDYVNIEDLTNAHILALKYLQNENKSQVINLGSNKGISVKEVFSVCKKITGKNIPLKICKKRNEDVPALIADNKKAKEILGWKPEKSLEYSINTAFNWSKKLTKEILQIQHQK